MLLIQALRGSQPVTGVRPPEPEAVQPEPRLSEPPLSVAPESVGSPSTSITTPDEDLSWLDGMTFDVGG